MDPRYAACETFSLRFAIAVDTSKAPLLPASTLNVAASASFQPVSDYVFAAASYLLTNTTRVVAFIYA
jgi:hypothetical protein